jgi:hypothetical protein
MGDTARDNYRRKHGRKSKGPPFVQLHYYLLDSEAWHRLSSSARAGYIELARLYKGVNNGNLAMSARRLAKLIPCNKDTAARVLNELESEGFIDVVKVGTFNRKERLACEYRLTSYRCDVTGELPSKRFDPSKRYAARSEIFGQKARKSRTDERQGSQPVRTNRTVNRNWTQSSVRLSRTHIESNHMRESAPPSSAVASAHLGEELPPWPWSVPTTPPRDIGSELLALRDELRSRHLVDFDTAKR